MNRLPAIVVSDIHLGGVPAETERKFRAFLKRVPEMTEHLLINGDLFDFWFEYRTVIHARHYRTLAALADVREQGVRIQFVGGNHDAWGGRFLAEEVGIEMLNDPVEVELAGRRALVVHGDGVGAGDLRYRALKRVIRHPLSERAFRLLHPDWGDRLAQLASTTERKHGNPEGVNRVRAEALKAWAIEQLERKRDLDLVLAGHTHTPTVLEAAPGRYYINTGDWINHCTYLVLAEGRPPDLRRWV